MAITSSVKNSKLYMKTAASAVALVHPETVASQVLMDSSAKYPNDSTVQAAIDTLRTKFVAGEVMVFKGVLNSRADLPDGSTEEKQYKKGWVYKVAVAGDYYYGTEKPVGRVTYCEVGDMIIYLNNFASSVQDTDFTIIQNNIDGAVTGPTSAVDGHVALFDGITGKIIKDAGDDVTLKDHVYSASETTEATIVITSATSSVNGVYAEGIKVDKVNVVNALKVDTTSGYLSYEVPTGAEDGQKVLKLSQSAVNTPAFKTMYIGDASSYVASAIDDSFKLAGAGSIGITLSGSAATISAPVLEAGAGITLDTTTSAGKIIAKTAAVSDVTLATNSVDIVVSKFDGTSATLEQIAFSGATSVVDGVKGLVPQPLIANREQFLKGDGSWADAVTSVSFTSSATGSATDGPVTYSVTVDGVTATGTLLTQDFARHPSVLATSDTAGHVKVGEGIAVTSGVIAHQAGADDGKSKAINYYTFGTDKYGHVSSAVVVSAATNANDGYMTSAHVSALETVSARTDFNTISDGTTSYTAASAGETITIQGSAPISSANATVDVNVTATVDGTTGAVTVTAKRQMDVNSCTAAYLESAISSGGETAEIDKLAIGGMLIVE